MASTQQGNHWTCSIFRPQKRLRQTSLLALSPGLMCFDLGHSPRLNHFPLPTTSSQNRRFGAIVWAKYRNFRLHSAMEPCNGGALCKIRHHHPLAALVDKFDVFLFHLLQRAFHGDDCTFSAHRTPSLVKKVLMSWPFSPPLVHPGLPSRECSLERVCWGCRPLPHVPRRFLGA
jgi:hypothetical protein